ncbi:hypothetical protein QKW60_03080 [Defluviimonas aestuarii]|uniref:hypothetical protein n=1 Tax=Albidovulum aestuarii TaxID=1130726 RepID=UPI00249A99D4|nr:hypothetical protein [Defluviimonas aestuarii]MDI3335378.1 hypothetical protein [Defluviimonas aestuarii]
MTHLPRISGTALALLLGTALIAAEPGGPLTAEEFEAATVGRTLFYNSGGEPYGVEQYQPGRQVVWAFLGDDCRKGEWYEDQGFICFVYEDNSEPQCWTFWQSDEGLLAKFRGDPFGLPLIAVEESPEPMACLNPNLGV